MMASKPLVELERVTKRFGSDQQLAIEELTARFYGGYVTGLVGPDGAGKTTLLRMIAGLLLPTQGVVRACGLDTRSSLKEIKQFVSYMPQRFGLYEDLTVTENLILYADLHGVVGNRREETTEKLLEFTGLKPFTNRLAGKLSGGMKQKLGLACSLIHQPRLLLLDEPSVGVDPISRRELWALVYELVDQGIAVVWSTAYLDEAERCGEVLALANGKALYAGPPQDLTAMVSGRSFLVQNAAHKRLLLANAVRLPGVIDGVIQGDSVRLVLGHAVRLPDGNELGDQGAMIVETAPRFEDAFIDLLGGGVKADSPLKGPIHVQQRESDITVEAVALTKRFGSFVAASDISFQIKRGEIFGLLGPNGAGKSTTFKMLCGLLTPTGGQAFVDGYDLFQAGGKARSKLGYMAQKFSLYGDLSTLQNLQFFSGIYGLHGKKRSDAIERIVDVFDFQPYLTANAKELPLGFKQRLALACAVMHDPPVLFLDEPTSGVDPLTRREFWSHINALVERGVTVLVTTHFLDEAEYCDRIALVYKGQVIASGSPDDLKGKSRSSKLVNPSLEDAFIELVEQFDRPLLNRDSVPGRGVVK